MKVPSNLITEVTESGIKGYDVEGETFGIFYCQISSVDRSPMGTVIVLESGDKIKLRMCHNRVNTILLAGAKGD